jgi:hypothetical protein
MSTSDNKSNTVSPQESQDDISVWNLIDSDPGNSLFLFFLYKQALNLFFYFTLDIFTDMIWGYGMRDVFAEDIKTLSDISKLPE